jgi:hypothetical protein
MRKQAILCSLLALAPFGCESMNNSQAGALGGGIIGAGVGTVIGGLTRHPLLGAAAGAAVGSGVGAMAGHSEDKRDQRVAQAYAARALQVNDVVQLVQSGQSDDVIMNQIYTTGSVYQLTPADLNYLRQQQVSDRIIMYMQSRTPGVVRAGPPGSVYVVGPPPPPVAVGVGIGFGGPYGRRW